MTRTASCFLRRLDMLCLATAKVERYETLPFTVNYIKRSERGMKESFVTR